MEIPRVAVAPATVMTAAAVSVVLYSDLSQPAARVLQGRRNEGAGGCCPLECEKALEINLESI